MQKLVEECPWWYKLVLIFCAVLIVVGIFIPPLGVIDGSILVAIGELGGVAAVGMLPTIVKSFKD